MRTFAVLSSLVLAALRVAAQSNTGAAGAVYTLNNEGGGNYILAHNIQSNGSIAFSKATYAGGKGFEAATQPDGTFIALFSAGSVVVFEDMLFAVNVGSSTISMFTINPQDPSELTQVGVPVASGGDFPISIDRSPTTGNICVLNQGTKNGVACFTVDKLNGLAPIQNTQRYLNVPQTTPPYGPGNTTSHVLFSEDGTKLYAAVKGDKYNVLSGYIATWDVNATDSSLSPDCVKSYPSAGGFDPFGMAIIPGQNAIFSTDPGYNAGPGLVVYDFKNATTGYNSASAKTFLIPKQSDTCWVLWSKQTGNWYSSDRVTSQITELALSADLQVSVVKQYQLAEGSSILDIALATIGGEDYLYVLSPNVTTIDALKLNGPGQAEHIQALNFGTDVSKIGISSQPSNVAGLAAYWSQQ